MLPENQTKTNQAVDAAQLGNLTRSQLKKLETKEKTVWQKAWEVITLALPVICGIVAILEGFERQSPQPTPLAGEKKAANCPGKMGLCSSCCFFPVSLFIQPFMTFGTFLHGIFIIIA